MVKRTSRVAAERVADVGGRGRVVELIVGQSVRDVEAREGAEVVELAPGAAARHLVAVLMQRAGVAGVVEHGLQRVAARSFEADDAGAGVGAVDGGVRAAVDLDAVDGGGADGAVVEGAADVLGGDAVDEDEVRGGVAAAQEERGNAARLAGLHEKDAGRLAHGVDDADLRGEGARGNDADRRGELRDGRRDVRGSNADGLLHRDCREHDILLEDICSAARRSRDRWKAGSRRRSRAG